MKTDRYARNAAATPSRGRLADFLFVGVAVVPVALLAGGEPAAALILFIPLLFAGCLFGMWAQVEPAPESDAGNVAVGQGPAKPPAGAGVNLRRRLP